MLPPVGRVFPAHYEFGMPLRVFWTSHLQSFAERVLQSPFNSVQMYLGISCLGLKIVLHDSPIVFRATVLAVKTGSAICKVSRWFSATLSPLLGYPPAALGQYLPMIAPWASQVPCKQFPHQEFECSPHFLHLDPLFPDVFPRRQPGVLGTNSGFSAASAWWLSTRQHPFGGAVD